MTKKVEEIVVEVEEQEEEVVGEEPTEELEQSSLLGMAHKVLLAAFGAAALTKEEMENFVNKLVERGEIAEKDGKKLMGDVMAKRKKEAKKAEAELDKRTEDLLGRMNVPTTSDIDALSAKITELSKKVDELKAAS